MMRLRPASPAARFSTSSTTSLACCAVRCAKSSNATASPATIVATKSTATSANPRSFAASGEGPELSVIRRLTGSIVRQAEKAPGSPAVRYAFLPMIQLELSIAYFQQTPSGAASRHQKSYSFMGYFIAISQNYGGRHGAAIGAAIGPDPQI